MRQEMLFQFVYFIKYFGANVLREFPPQEAQQSLEM